MRLMSAFAAASLIAAAPAAAANPAQALSIARAAPMLEDENFLTRGELYPLLGLALAAVLALALLDGTTEGQAPPVSA